MLPEAHAASCLPVGNPLKTGSTSTKNAPR
jgi:hypothetical protein